MALSYQNYTGDNVTDTFSIPFTYTDTSEISVTVDGVAQTGLTFPSASTVQLTSPPATSTLVQVRRATDLTARSIDYVSGSVLTEEQEIIDQAQALAQQKHITSINGKPLKINAESICVHGDNQDAVKIIKKIKSAISH